MKKDFWSAQMIARIGVLSALSAILYWIPGLVIIAPFYKLDFSSIPAVFAGFAMGPMAALLVTLIKNLTGILHSSSGAMGQLADFIMSGTYAVVAALIYQKYRSTGRTALPLIGGTLAMVLISAPANAWVVVPVYSWLLNMSVETIVGAINASLQAMGELVGITMPVVDSLWKMIVMATLPFTLFKGVVLSIIIALLYRYCKPLLGDKGGK